MTFRVKTPRARIEQHLRFLRDLPCLICRRTAEAAHIRFSDASVGRTNPGVGSKSSDYWAVPLCPECHRLSSTSQHEVGEKNFWRGVRIDVSRVAMALWINSGNHQVCENIISLAKEKPINDPSIFHA